eukprot:jgi/Orpsp1_1/1186538/evm.model.d7180000051320.1
MMGMTVKVHQLSKKYGDTKFIFFIVLLLISSFIFQQAFTSFMSTSNIDPSISPTLLITIFIQLLTNIITVHLLIGNRLLYIRKHPITSKNKLNSSDLKNINKIAKFIAMKNNMDSSFSFSNKSTNKEDSSSRTYISIDSSYSRKEQMMSNNNYRSFSHTLQSM